MSTLIVVDQAPYGSWTGREALDMTLSLAAFDQPAALLFTGAGVNWLRTAQAPEHVGQKSAERNLCPAPSRGDQELLACAESCQRYGHDDANMIGGIARVANTAETMNRYHQVVFAG